MTCRMAILLPIGFGEHDTTGPARYCTSEKFNLGINNEGKPSLSRDVVT